MEQAGPGQLGQNRGQGGIAQKGPGGLLPRQKPREEAIGKEAKGEDVAAKGVHRRKDPKLPEGRRPQAWR
jgi:hypothetical protein